MFNKPTFGSNTSGFGSFNTTAAAASPFGGGFKPAATTFGAPTTFGANATQPAAGGLFGASNTSTGLFGGSTSTATAAFGNTSSGFGFGASTSTGGLFGSSNPSTGLFGNAQNTSAFGAAVKPAGFGFGATAAPSNTGGGLFGATAAPSTGLFAQPTNTLGGGLFSNNAGTFGQQQAASGTAHAKYNPVVGTDVVVKSGTSQTINTKHHCITCMKEYEGKSLEELRLDDYTAGRKGGGGGGVFGFQQTETKPLFGGNTFGQTATTTASTVFGGGGLGATTGGFGQTNTFSFGNNTQNTTNTSSGLFGAAKPAFGATATTGTGLFGATTTQAPTFGTTTPSFGFGSNTQPQTGGLFGAKPATTGFGAPASTGFGAFGGGGLFAAKPQQTTAPTFGSTAPAFGALSGGGFGANTATTGSLFGGGNTFGKPATSQPAFGFNTTNTGLGGSLGGTLGATSFQAKPATQPFGSLGGGTMFQPQTTNNFAAGLDSGLGGGGLFSNTSTLGGSSLGLGGLGANTSAIANNNLSGASAAGNVHEQILTLVARPYGDSPLFKDLPPDTATSSEVLKPTNPAAVKAVLDSSSPYRVTDSAVRLKLRHMPTAHDKKSLFDGLEEYDASLEDKLCLKPSRKRLVLRPRAQDDVDAAQNRSLEEQPQQAGMNGPSPKDVDNNKSALEDDRGRKNSNHSNHDDTNNLETSTDRHGSWLNASKHQWSAEKEKPVDSEPTPRLYPNLDKENPMQITTERRASWLTTKPLRKPLKGNPESAENSVRELGLRPADRSHDKENVDTLSISEEENVAPRDLPPHPTGVKLTRPGYYTIPSLDEMIKYMRADGSCVVPHLTIGRKNYGNVYYDCEIDVAGLDLDALVHFLNKEVTIYPDDSAKPPVGSGLNRRAIVTLDRVWPRDKTERRPITDPDRLLAMDYEGKLRRVCDKHDTKFIEYRPQTGSWVFRVEHFSKYSLTDSDEEDDPTPDVIKRQLVNNQMQKAAPIAPPKPPVQPSPGLGGLGGPLYPGLAPGLVSPGLAMSPLYPSGGLAGPALLGHDDLYAMQQTSLNLLNGAGKAFEMDTTEDNTESQSLYQDTHRAYGVKSPTSELARLEHRQSHNVQLMKASLYTDTEMDDAASVSTGDQQVPLARSVPSPVPAADPYVREDTPLIVAEVSATEVPLKPLIVRPHTIVLQYHRKVMPFRKTIAGRLDASYIADMSVCRSRHSRVGFGPSGSLVYPTSYDAISTLPRNADLCDLGRYVRGRSDEDWSEAVVARLAIGQQEKSDTSVEILSRHLETLSQNAPQWPQVLPSGQGASLSALTKYCRELLGTRRKFGVTSSYCYEVFRLCEALWGDDLENGGVAGTDDASIVNRHRKLVAWLTEAVSVATDEDLKTPVAPDPQDESDSHSSRVWSLLLGGRVLAACELAVARGDCNMAALIAQCAGDPTFRSLVSRQLSQWRECGAAELISSYRMAALQLIAGESRPRDKLQQADWLRAFHAAARYLCPQVPTLDQVLRTYESLFVVGEMEDEGVDLSAIDADEMGMKLPVPPYLEEYDVSLLNSGKHRRVLDLRYELLRARAFNTRPKLQPAMYTPDPMDYSLCFILGTWFGSVSAEIACGAAAQLEAAGAWHLAVQVLQYHPNTNAASQLIRDVLSRHAPATSEGPAASRLSLLRRLNIPEKWVLLAQAHRAKYQHLHLVEAQHLVGAEQWNAAHRVVLEELLPNAVLSDDLQSIAPLLEKLNEAASRHEVSGWESGGQALYYYTHVCDEIRGLVTSAESSAEASVSSRLEALRPLVSSACRALCKLPAMENGKYNPRRAAARAEMGARLLQLALAAGEPPHHLAMLLKQLKLPPDTTATAMYKITTDLAERAADMCIESAESSPISSHHRAIVHS